MRFLKRVVFVLALILGALLLLAGVGYLRAETPKPVARTVVDDPGLPQLEIGGVKLHLQTFGEPGKPVVIALHGGPGDDHLQLMPLKALADEYRVVLYDQRGSGLSERVDNALIHYEGFVEELDAVVDRFSPDEPVRLIGHSWGAMLATGYMGQHPERVAQAVLVEPGFLTPEAGEAFLEKAGGMPRIDFALVRLFWRIWMESLKLDGPDDDARADYFMLRLVSSEMEGHPLGGYFCDGKPRPESLKHFRFGTRVNSQGQKSLMGEDGKLKAPFAKGIEAFENKVLMLTGSCNKVTGKEHQERYHRPLFPLAELRVVEGAGHMVFTEQPEQVLELIRSYFRDWPPAGAGRQR